MRRILFIAHHFPPLGGAGVQRSVKFVKYLPSCAFLPIVLTGDGRSTGRWTPEDRSLAEEIPATASVHRANNPKQLQRFWAGHRTASSRLRREALIATGSEVIRAQRPSLIFVTMSPFADAAVAASLSHQFKIPWVADLRDPWALDEFQVYRTRWHRRRERCRMRKALESASLIIMNTPEAASCLRSALSALNSIPVISLPNGYDEDDFAETLTPRHNPKFTVVHTGAMHTDVGLRQQRRRYEFNLLGRLQPGVELLSRSHYFLVKALESWIAEQPALVDQLEVVFAGVPTAEDQAVTDQSRISRIFRFTGYLPHAESVQRLRTADLLFLPLHKVSPSRRASIVPGKTYEYMASGRPILAAVPDGDAKDFLNAAGTAQISEPDDVEKIREILEIQYRRWASNRTETSWNQTFVKQFERRRLTEQLAEQLRALVG